MTSTARWMVALVAAWLVAVPAQRAFAEQDTAVEEADESAVDDGPIVRHKLLYRSTRFEIAPHAALSINDAFRRNVLFGANVMYHLTNEFGIGASFAYGPIHFNTSLANNVRDTLQSTNPGALQTISYTQMQFMGAVSLGYVPIFGKFSLLKSASFNYDLHLGLGVSFVSEQATAAVDGGATDDALTSLRPGGEFDLGFRLFLTDMLSLNVDLKNLFYSRAEVSAGSASAELSHVPVATVGVGIFFPGEVKISR